MADSDGKPVVWGVDDCGLSFANIVRDALGYDSGETWRGRYDTQQGARDVLGNGGLGFAFRMLARKHGWRRIEPTDAKVGDPALGIFDGSVSTMIARGAMGLFLVRNETAFSILPSRHARLCWSLG